MNMSFNRFRAQLRCEELVGCTTQNDWNNKRQIFDKVVLTEQQAAKLQLDLIEDSKDLYFKGTLSLFDAISSLHEKLFSWATIKLYYSVFYFLRCSLAVNGIALIRNKSLYSFKANVGSSPVKKTNSGYRNDHVGVINFYNEIFGNSDKLSSNNIEGVNPYFWLMNKRNQTHYNDREFRDPFAPEFLTIIEEKIQKEEFSTQIDKYIDDPDYIYCFQEDHACVALPLKRALETLKDINHADVQIVFQRHKFELLNTLTSFNGHVSQGLRKLIL